MSCNSLSVLLRSFFLHFIVEWALFVKHTLSVERASNIFFRFAFSLCLFSARLFLLVLCVLFEFILNAFCATTTIEARAMHEWRGIWLARQVLNVISCCIRANVQFLLHPWLNEWHTTRVLDAYMIVSLRFYCRNELINTYANRTGQMVVALSRFISRSWWLNATLRFACSTCKPILNAKFYARKCGTRLVMHRFTVCSKRRDEFRCPESVKWTNTNKSRPIWIPCEISSVN